MVQAVFCMEILHTYGIQKVTEEAFIDYFQVCLLMYPYMFSVVLYSAIPDKFGLKHSEDEGETL